MDTIDALTLAKFIDIFDTEIPKQVLTDYCNRSKPGKDKINYQKFKKDFDRVVPALREQIIKRNIKSFSRMYRLSSFLV